MNFMLKAIGLAIIFSVSTFVGLNASHRLKMRCEMLRNYENGISVMFHRIKADAGNIQNIISFCFKGDVTAENGKINFKKDFLKKEDTELFEDFFKNIGRLNKTEELKRIELFLVTLNAVKCEAEEKRHTLSKLYKSSGVLIGLMICIFLI